MPTAPPVILTSQCFSDEEGSRGSGAVVEITRSFTPLRCVQDDRRALIIAAHSYSSLSAIAIAPLLSAYAEEVPGKALWMSNETVSFFQFPVHTCKQVIRVMYYTYIVTNKKRGIPYTGITNDLIRRAYQHKHKLVKGFTSRYNLDRLVWFEEFQWVQDAIAREKEKKDGQDKRKSSLLNQ